MRINEDNTITLTNDECEKLFNMIHEEGIITSEDKLACVFRLFEESSPLNELSLNLEFCLKCEDKKYKKFIKRLNTDIFGALSDRIVNGSDRVEISKYLSKLFMGEFVVFVLIAGICLLSCITYNPQLWLCKMFIRGTALLMIIQFSVLFRRGLMIYRNNNQEE